MSRGSDFWTRRRAAARAEEDALATDEAQAEVARQTADLEEKSDEEIIAELGLPDPDSLTLGDNVKAFMASGVPERIRRRALRRFWNTNPVLANLDGLADYTEDFTDAATVVADLKTTYQVGKGLLRHVEYVAEQEKAKQEAANAPVAETDPTIETEPSDPPDRVALATENAAPASATKVEMERAAYQDDTELTQEQPRPRRMTFSFRADAPEAEAS